ncbi:phosphatase PAP2 family protein [Tichowtungia aerotolerans]|uniref:Uncharacterized protein n=1 Tax=Tichowtungia aerotolerans TaxID=2697043 RepID=A0A6P1MHZ7_9BACT|nr:hypothetical protein [Tichowtungia aerotolerans]QHI70675.1 hypothetical protein GT409_14920 [Tichowtungia aerotolerans]
MKKRMEQLIVLICIMMTTSVSAREWYYQMGFDLSGTFLDKFTPDNYNEWTTARSRMDGMNLINLDVEALSSLDGTVQQKQYKTWQASGTVEYDSGVINRVWTEGKSIDWVAAVEVGRLNTIRNKSAATNIVFAIQSTLSKDFTNNPTPTERIELIDSLIVAVETKYQQLYPANWSTFELQWALIDASPAKNMAYTTIYAGLINCMNNRGRNFKGIYLDYPAAIVLADGTGSTLTSVANYITGLGKWAGWYLSPGISGAYQENMVSAAGMVATSSNAVDISRITVCDFQFRHSTELPDTINTSDSIFPMMETFNRCYLEF